MSSSSKRRPWTAVATDFIAFIELPLVHALAPVMSESAGRSCASNCSPASVGDTLCVVRVSVSERLHPRDRGSRQ